MERTTKLMDPKTDKAKNGFFHLVEERIKHFEKLGKKKLPVTMYVHSGISSNSGKEKKSP